MLILFIFTCLYDKYFNLNFFLDISRPAQGARNDNTEGLLQSLLYRGRFLKIIHKILIIYCYK